MEGWTGSGLTPAKSPTEPLREAGHEPEVIKSYGLWPLPDRIFNRSRGRREVKRLTGSSMVPVLATDSGEVVRTSRQIAAWAKAHPIGSRPRVTAPNSCQHARPPN